MGDSTREIALDGVGPHHIAPTGDVEAASDDPGVTITRSDLAWQVSAGPNGAVRLNGLVVENTDSEPLEHGDFISIEGLTLQVAVGPRETNPKTPPATHQSEVNTRNWTSDESTRPSIFLRLEGGEVTRELGWDEFTNRYSSIIRSFAMSRGLDWSDAEDVVQEVLIAFLRRSPSFVYDTQKGQFRGYLRTMTLNAIRRRGRRAARQQQVTQKLASEQETSTSDQVAWDLQWTAHLVSEGLREIRPRFDEQTLEIFERVAVRGEPVSSVASAMSMTPEAIRQAKFRVAKAVREEIQRMRRELG